MREDNGWGMGRPRGAAMWGKRSAVGMAHSNGMEGCCEWSGEILRLRCAQSDTGPWPRGMGPRMREDNGRGEGAHEGRPYGGRVVWWAVGMAHSNGMEWR